MNASTATRRYHADGTLPGAGVVFVFGSNEAGRHGKGAALAARERFGARYGQGVGPSGMSYAIPTKDRALRTLALPAVARYVRDFIEHARAHPDQAFFVSRIGCGLAGYADKDIAPMFADAPANCSFADSWRAFLAPQPQAPASPVPATARRWVRP